MKFVDYYQVMGVAETASADEIKKAYRRLARKYHPDVSKEADAEARFKELGEAYEVLKDPDKRAEYDELRRYGAFQGGEFRPPPNWQSRANFSEGGFTEADARQFSDFFEAIFGGRGSPGPAAGPRGAGFALRGEDIHYRLPVTLEEAHGGGSRAISFAVQDATGRVASEPKTLKVTIPAGVTDGQRIRLKGQGHPGIGGAPGGDLFLHVELEPHPRFAVDGRDLTLVLPVAPWEAALGGPVNVPTLSGVVKLNLPANARAGQKLRLKGKGLAGQPSGDLYVIVQIVLPKVATEAERELFKALARQMPFNPRAELGV